MKQPPRSVNMTLNLAPMVDVMMCLIIFFLIASQLATAEFDVDLPWAAGAKVVERSELGNPVTIGVRRAADGSDAAEYLVADWDGEQVVHRTLTPEALDALLMKRARLAQGSQDTLRCVIYADQDVEFRFVERVLRACGVAQISKIVFPAHKGLPPELAT